MVEVDDLDIDVDGFLAQRFHILVGVGLQLLHIVLE